MEEWNYLQREEESLLEEVEYISQGTVSSTHAAGQLHYFDQEKQESLKLFNLSMKNLNIEKNNYMFKKMS